MTNDSNRLYGYDPVYDRLDRMALIGHYKKHFPMDGEEILRLKTRSDLIESILEAETLALADTDSDPDDYPLRRLEEVWDPATTLTRKSGQRLYWCWEDDTLASAKSLVTDIANHHWNVGHEIRKGDLVLTTLACTPPLVIALEVAETVFEDEILVERLGTFSNPISLFEIEERLNISLPRRSQKLDAPTTDRVLAIIAELISSPQPIFVSAGDCTPLKFNAAHELLFVTALLQQGMVDEISCDACGRPNPDRLEPHLFRPKPEDVFLEIQDHIDDTALLCSGCHAIAHQPSLQQLREFAAAPPCPGCGERNRQAFVWGLPPESPDESIVCYMMAPPPRHLPQWSCNNCNTSFAVVAHRDFLGYPYAHTDEKPVYE